MSEFKGYELRGFTACQVKAVQADKLIFESFEIYFKDIQHLYVKTAHDLRPGDVITGIWDWSGKWMLYKSLFQF